MLGYILVMLLERDFGCRDSLLNAGVCFSLSAPLS